MRVVMERNGRRQEITGWRRWLLAFCAIMVAAIVATAVIILVLGLTVTIGVVVLIAIPAVLIMALIARLLMGGAARPT
jgi:predicted anti-sigma-YlaC factor YlaD